jgi:hypothetical protein
MFEKEIKARKNVRNGDLRRGERPARVREK